MGVWLAAGRPALQGRHPKMPLSSKILSLAFSQPRQSGWTRRCRPCRRQVALAMAGAGAEVSPAVAVAVAAVVCYPCQQQMLLLDLTCFHTRVLSHPTLRPPCYCSDSSRFRRASSASVSGSGSGLLCARSCALVALATPGTTRRVRAWARVVLAHNGGSRLRRQFCPVGRDRSRLAVGALRRWWCAGPPRHLQQARANNDTPG
eukprot:COSAG04_NODE_1222_length_7694_cov_1.527979_2_plen_204_part_00